MDLHELLADAVSRPRDAFHEVLDGLSPELASRPPAEGCNTVAWLAWHAARQADVQLAHLVSGVEVWVRDGWVDRFGLDLPADSLGYGHTPAEAAKVVVDDVALLVGYLDAVLDAVVAHCRTVSAEELDRVVDRSWDPPVTHGVRLVSLIDDAAQHAGQAAYVVGLLTAGD